MVILAHLSNFLKKCPEFLCSKKLKGLFHPACFARVVSWFAFVVAIFLGHENGDKQRPAERPLVQGMLDETEPLSHTTQSNQARLENLHSLTTLISPEQDSDQEQDSDSEKSQNMLTITQNISILHKPKLITDLNSAL